VIRDFGELFERQIRSFMILVLTVGLVGGFLFGYCFYGLRMQKQVNELDRLTTEIEKVQKEAVSKLKEAEKAWFCAMKVTREVLGENKSNG
jgi:Tfp pilus assembly protein PilN